MKRFVLLVPALTVLLAGCGGGHGSSHSAAVSAAPAAATPADAGEHNDADVTFARDMVPHHQQAVEMAALVTTRASSPKVKALAARVQKAQGPEITTMSGWLASWGRPLPSPVGGMTGMDHGTLPGMGAAASASGGTSAQAAMPGMMSDADMTKLSSLTGTEFDTSWLTMMTAHHRGAIVMARTEQVSGRYQPARDLAGRIVTAQQAEIEEMKGLLAGK